MLGSRMRAALACFEAGSARRASFSEICRSVSLDVVTLRGAVPPADKMPVVMYRSIARLYLLSSGSVPMVKPVSSTARMRCCRGGPAFVVLAFRWDCALCAIFIIIPRKFKSPYYNRAPLARYRPIGLSRLAPYWSIPAASAGRQLHHATAALLAATPRDSRPGTPCEANAASGVSNCYPRSKQRREHDIYASGKDRCRSSAGSSAVSRQ